MTLRAGYTMHQSGLEDFLWAPIWEAENGSELSILSALARLEMDPWKEAAQLAAMRRDTATAALATILARLPAPGSEPPDHLALARRLIELLPQRHAAGPTDPQAPRQAEAERRALNPALLLVLAAVLGFLQVNGWLF